ncbi:MAG: amino acid adenylation domain-containing protein, partial [Prevotella sp.]
ADTDLAAFHREQDSYPLTENQRGIYIDWELNRDTTQYNVPVAVCLGQQDADGLAEVLRQVVDAHSYIKTRLARHEGNVVQLRRDNAPVQVSVTRLDSEPDSEFFQQRVRPFDLYNDDLYRLEIYTYGGRTWLFRDIHHIMSDGLSSAIFFRDMLAACQGTKPQAETVTAFDFALYEQQLSSTSRYDEARDYFDDLLAGTEVASYPRSSNGSKHESQTLTASINDSKAVRKACRRIGITPNSYFQTVVAQVLHSVTRQQRLMLATVSNGRSLAQTQNIVGMFVKTLPMVSEIAPDGTTFSAAAQAMHRQSIQSLNHDFYPLTEMVERHGLRPEILYVFESGIYDNVAAPFSSDTEVIVPRLDTQKLPIEVLVNTDQEDNYTIQVNYDAALYSRSSMEALAGALTAYAAHAVQDGILLGNIELTTSDERAALVELGAGKYLDVNPQMTFVKAFEACASKNPDCLAVVDATDSLTYEELSRRSDVLAHRLIASGVKSGDFVAVMLDRTIAFPLAVIAIHKAGAAYVPIDLEYPEERQRFMLEDCGAKVVIDSRFLEETDLAVSGETADHIDLSTPDGPAYMIYTSGSTGKPKGAVLHQAGLWNFIQVIVGMEGLTAADRIAIHRSFSFDAHVEDLFPVLTVGGSLHIMPSAIRLDLNAIRRFLLEHQITGGGYATAMGKMLLETFDDLPMRITTLGGEKLTSAYSDHITIINVYGPTECTDDTSYYIIEPGRHVDAVPIGRPVANGYYFLVDPQGRLVPRGAVGELCFAGIQVGLGYWQQPELTASVFTDCPFLPPLTPHPSPVRMYHTGDLGRWNDEGQMEYIGRKDAQVKLRGYRIELGEIEACATRFDGIAQAVAVIRPLAGSDALCLYYTTGGEGTTIDTDELRQFLGRTLADYMVPVAYMQLDALPLTPNGKVDRRRLPGPSLLQEDVVAPASEMEQQLFDIVARQLGTEAFGVTTDLVTIGMSSLDAMRLSLAISQQTGLQVYVSELLEHPTIRYMAEMALRPQIDTDTDLAAFHREQDSYPLTENQRGIYIDWELNRDTTQYNVPVAVCLGQQDADGLAEALRQVVDAHSYIKTRLARHEGSVVQLRRDNAPVQVSVTRLDSEPDSVFFQQRVRPFDLFNDNLYRLEIYTYGGRTWLFRDIHHIVCDGLSSAIFFRDMLAACQGTKPQAETVTAFDFALYEQQLSSTSRYEEARNYFDDLLAGTEVASYPRSSNGSKHESQTVTASINDSKAVRKACRRIGITPNSYFQTVVAQVLHSVTRQQRLMLATVSNGRSLAQTQNIVGMFVKTLPMVSEIAPDGTTFSAAAQAMHRQSIQSMNHDFYPLTEMVERHGLRPEILYVFEGGIYDNVAAPFSSDTDVIVPRLDTQKMPIEVMVNTDQEGNYTIQLNYD